MKRKSAAYKANNGSGSRRSNRTVLKVYRSYLFRNKDPVIDALRTVVSDAHMKYSEIHNVSNVSTTTLYGWFHGRVRRPQFATVAAVARSMGVTNIKFGRDGRPSLTTD